MTAPLLASSLSGATGENRADPYWWQKDADKPTFKPQGVDRSKVLRIYSDRMKPDISPVLMIWEALHGVPVDLTVQPNAEILARVRAERNDAQADILITNSMVESEGLRTSGALEAYRAPVAERYPEWLRAADYRWLSFSAWPRAAMINWKTLGRDPRKWPHRLEDLAAPEFRDSVVIASVQERTLTNYITAVRIARGDEWAGRTLDRILDNGARIYRTHSQARDALLRQGYAVALVNSSNTHAYFLEGHAVGEAWLDQEEGGLGTSIDAHTISILHGARQSDIARQFVDFMLSREIQEFLARRYGEVPVNPTAMPGWTRPLDAIRRVPVSVDQLVLRFKDSQEFLKKRGFDLSDVDDPFISSGRGGRRRDQPVPAST